jgi:ureidoglycolate lyase
MKQIKIKAKPLTADAFAPFGVILSNENRTRLPINSYGDKANIYREGFESDQPIEWLIPHFTNRGNKPTYLEKHLQLTQTFIPLGNKPYIMVVAKPDAPTQAGLPKATEIHAFYVRGNQGVQLHRGTWHENPMPAEDEVTLIVSSHQSLTRGHQSAAIQQQLEGFKLDVEKYVIAEKGGFEINVEW